MTTPKAVSLDSLELRRFETSDYDEIVQLIAREDWFIFEKSKFEKIVQELQPVFYVLVDKNTNGYIIGTIVVRQTRDGEAILSDVIIREGLRGRGFGRFMVQNVFKLYSHLTLSWFSTTDQFYKKIGSHPCGQATFFGDMTVDREKVEKYCQENKLEKETKVVSFTEDRRQDLIRYDADARGYRSEKGVSLTIATSDYLAIAVQGNDERIVGYMGNDLEPSGRLRPDGFYADDQTVAAHLLRQTLTYFPAVQILRLYTLDTRQFLAEFGHLNKTEIHTRFSHGGIPVKVPEEKLYCCTQPDVCY